MEKQFAYLEYDIARITDQWVEMVRAEGRLTQIPIPDQNRHLVSQFLSLQFMRTADFREILPLSLPAEKRQQLDAHGRRVLHTTALWDDRLLADYTEYIESAIWLFGKNESGIPFLTSDNPVAFRTPDHAMWLKTAMLGSETYVVYPLAPDVVLYCYPRIEQWASLDPWNGCISPVEFDEEMVQSENSGQVFMASRFVLSDRNDFAEARAFAKTIGTEVHTRKPDAP